jgi:carbonic anhydrase/acetyltransferase-like protein (isoleucine patch superfamily)
VSAASPLRGFEGHDPRLEPGAWVDPSATVIGDVTLGADASVWPRCVLRGDIHRIRVGAETNIQDASVLHVTHDGPHSPGGHAVEIGARVTVGHGVILHGCSIGDLCLVGMGSIVMDGAVIPPRVVLGAGSLVSPGKELTSGFLWLGRPARRIRPLSEEELAYLEYSAAHYVRLKNRHAAGAGVVPAPSGR